MCLFDSTRLSPSSQSLIASLRYQSISMTLSSRTPSPVPRPFTPLRPRPGHMGFRIRRPARASLGMRSIAPLTQYKHFLGNKKNIPFDPGCRRVSRADDARFFFFSKTKCWDLQPRNNTTLINACEKKKKPRLAMIPRLFLPPTTSLEHNSPALTRNLCSEETEVPPWPSGQLSKKKMAGCERLCFAIRKIPVFGAGQGLKRSDPPWQ